MYDFVLTFTKISYAKEFEKQIKASEYNKYFNGYDDVASILLSGEAADIKDFWNTIIKIIDECVNSIETLDQDSREFYSLTF